MMVARHMLEHRGMSRGRELCSQSENRKTMEGHVPICYFHLTINFIGCLEIGL